MSLNVTHVPKMTYKHWEVGCDVAKNYNNLCEKLLENKNLEWLWILGDDHTFKSNTLMNLLDRNVDIVAPLCLKRTPPFGPVAYKIDDDKYYQLTCEYFRGKKGLLKVAACGNAGMLIRRRVIEEIGSDWHRVGWITPDEGSSDLYFCKKAGKQGFDLHVDLDNPIGHLSHMAVWPTRNMMGEYSVGIGQAMEVPEDHYGLVAEIPKVFDGISKVEVEEANV